MKTIVGKNYLRPETKVIKVKQERYLCTGTTEGDNKTDDSRALKSFFEEEE